MIRMMGDRRLAHGLLAVMLAATGAVACGSTPRPSERPPAEGEQAATRFTTVVLSERWRDAEPMISTHLRPEVPVPTPFPNILKLLENFHRELHGLDAEITGPPTWESEVESLFYLDDAFYFPFRGADDERTVCLGYVQVSVNHTEDSWRVDAFHYVLSRVAFHAPGEEIDCEAQSANLQSQVPE
jgi:hypothetical protein